MKKILFTLLATSILCVSSFYHTTAQTTQVTCIQCDENSNPSGNYASTIGMSDTASGYCAFSGGFGSHSSGNFSFSFGNKAKALGNYSLAIGPAAKAIQTGSIAIGTSITSNAYQAMVFGHGQISSPLVNNTDQAIMFGTNSDLPTLFIQKAIGTGYTGKIGIGNVTNPQAKLHILGDSYSGNPTEASLYIQSAGNYYSTLWLGDKNHSIYTKPGSDFKFKTSTNNHFVFENGNVGIATTSSPTEKLEVNGNIKQAEGYQIETDKLLSKSRNGLKLFTSLNSGIFIDSRGQVAIGKSTPTTALDVNGKIKASALQIPDPMPPDNNGRRIKGYVLTSYDEYGNVGWTPQHALDDGDWDKNGDDVSKTTGKVGIGTNNPSAQLHIADIGPAGSVNLKVGDDTYLSDMDQTHTLGIISVYDNNVGALMLGLTGPKLYGSNGCLGIGTTTMAGYTLAVAGKIRSTEVTIEHIDDWYDCVFEEDYPLTPLAEIEQFVRQNKHLPEVPSEAEVKENGIDLGEMNSILLKKIEELTLHVIQQQKEIDALKQAIK